MRFHITQNLRPYDAGIIELGLVYSDKMAIPPSQESFSLSGYCLPECTATVSTYISNISGTSYKYTLNKYLNILIIFKGFPIKGITIFGSQLHTHGSGVGVSTKHYRDGMELQEINRDDHYSAHFQEIRRLHEQQTVLPVRIQFWQGFKLEAVL